MSRRKNLEPAIPTPLQQWREVAPGTHMLAHLSDLTDAMGQRLSLPNLCKYASGERMPTPANRELIELATLGAVSREAWYVTPRQTTGRRPRSPQCEIERGQ